MSFSRALPVLSAVALAACTATPRTAALPPGPVPVSSPPAPAATSSALAPPACVERVFDRLSVRQRVGQLFMLGLAGDQLGSAAANAIRQYHFGSVWFTETSSIGASRIRAITDSVQALTAGGVRFFIAANQEGGLIQAMKGHGFSSLPAAELQGTIDPSRLQADATRWGRELAAAGINFNFAPVFDVVPQGTDTANRPIGALHREFGHDVPMVATHALAFVRGMSAVGVETSAKHFPGLGRVTGNTDYTSDVVDDVTTTNDLGAFEQAVSAGVPFVMVALATYTKIDPDHVAALSPVVIKQVLRGRLGFGGVVISDDLGATVAVKDISPGTRAIDFLEAGGDMIVSKTLTSATSMYGAILARAASDARFSRVVNDAVHRILGSKRSAGLLRCS